MTPIKQYTFNSRLTGGIPFEIFPIESREDLQPGTLFCIAPGQVHYWQVSEPLRGMAMQVWRRPPAVLKCGCACFRARHIAVTTQLKDRANP